jgi:tRNA A37 threonylcarbamoyladenosine dehydratase
MGAALRFDPGAVKSGPLKEIKNDRLARIIRRRLRKRGVSDEHLCVYSTEDQDAARLKMQVNSDTAGLKKIQKSNALFNRGRDREIIGSLPTIPAIFGMFLANIAILKLSEK